MTADRCRLALAVALAMGLAGCAGSPRRPPPEFARGMPLEELPAQPLRPGACAGFIWMEGEPPKRIAMLTGDPAEANVVLWGKSEKFALEAKTGEAAYGLAPRMVYKKYGVTLTFDLKIRTDDRLSGGAIVESGSLTYADRGWEMVARVAGVIGCEPK